MTEHIYPEFERMLGRDAKERLLDQRGCVIWCFGRSGSGKSTLANALERKLHSMGRLTQILDGDNIRTGLNSNLGFSDEDRAENIRRIAEVAKLFCSLGVITITSFICPTRKLRDLAQSIVGADDFLEVFIQASFETCAKRDPKGLYAKVEAGLVKNFTGKDSLFEEPQPGTPNLLCVDTESLTLEEGVDAIFKRACSRFDWGREG